MRVKQVVWILLLGALNSGCSLGGIATRNLYNEMALTRDRCVERFQLRRLADDTWHYVCGQSGPCCYSVDYADGFKDGFVDFIDAGGTGEPPPLPPKRYQRLRFQTPQGWKAAEDWYAGFRHGAAVAKEHGCRLLVALPGPMPYPPNFGPHPPPAPGAATPSPPLAPGPDGMLPPTAPTDSAPTLPAPRPVPADTPRLEGMAPTTPAVIAVSGPAGGVPGARPGEVVSTWAQGSHCADESVLVIPFKPTGSGRFAASRLEAAPAAPPVQPPPPAAPPGAGVQPVPPAGPTFPPLSRGPSPADPKADGVRPVSWTPSRNDPPPSFGL